MAADSNRYPCTERGILRINLENTQGFSLIPGQLTAKYKSTTRCTAATNPQCVIEATDTHGIPSGEIFGTFRIRRDISTFTPEHYSILFEYQ
jgi:hypothetical protein